MLLFIIRRKTPMSNLKFAICDCLKTLYSMFKVYILVQKRFIMANFKIGVGNNIKMYRKLKNITQEELSEIVGIHSRQLSKIETGEHFPSCKTLERICMALDVSPKEMFDFEFLEQEVECVLTGTSNEVFYKVETDKNYSNVIPLHNPDESKVVEKSSTDLSMSKIAKTLGKPIFVEYLNNQKVEKIVVFYPDGKEKVVKNTEDVEAKQNLNFMMNELKKISKDKSAIEFVKTAIESLNDDNALTKLESIVQGMKLVRKI